MENEIAGYLHLKSESGDIKFNLKIGDNYIGRQASNNQPDIALNDILVSRGHAILSVKVTEIGLFLYFIKDASSTNGTFVNNFETKITQITELKNNDIIKAGDTKLQLETIDKLKELSDKEKLSQKIENKDNTNDNQNNTPSLKRIIKR